MDRRRQGKKVQISIFLDLTCPIPPHIVLKKKMIAR
jgi:hypothetical protein